MNIIIPMAGRGTRLRPHTLTVPKPLIPIAGKPIVQRLVEDIAKVYDGEISQIGFIIDRDFGAQIEADLKQIAAAVGSEGVIFYQDEKLGTAHAILCAADLLEGNVTVAYADTLFKADFNLDASKDAIIWVQQVDDPSAFGVVTVNDHGIITEFVEKPKKFVSDLAIIGIYYFRDGANLKAELQYLIDEDIRKGMEYQLTDALENMKKKGLEFVPGQVSEWLDCGNKDATVYTNKRYLEYLSNEKLIHDSVQLKNSVIVPPVFLDENVTIENCIIGPHVSVGKGSAIKNSIIQNTIIQTHSELNNIHLKNSMIGNYVTFEGTISDVSLGDYNNIQ
ncbi:sugar phosphate nucleotidyltransferase [Fulvivirga sedimenti]|uniref:NTP transferase domain-containing protein n=1 Tax=Fulvivirga sedimenti TaxID=2879465 RepID=A0A9X1HX59_9BACT|nr:sugar phosphate nucleotidyltransferase [Fulvivirga sedimenti]MCA6078067.1 NTP transferase domain-containing protein [Fulvivirga sedimenti]